jgi:lysophospholipase L1-like esterase
VTANDETTWVSAWYAAPVRLVPADVCGRTFRQIVHPHSGGDQIRLRISNRYGDEPVEVSSTSVARVIGGPIVQPGRCAVMFGGRPTLILRPGQEAVSDPVTFAVEAFADLAVTFFLATGEPVTGHFSGRQTSFLSGLGDVSSSGGLDDFVHYPLPVTASWLLTGLDVRGNGPVNVLVAFGSSTTQGAGSTVDAHRSWPDQLSRRLWNTGGDRFMSVVNAGIGGNQLTSAEVTVSPTPDLPLFLMGDRGEARLAWDALTQPGATDLIVNIGSNDLRNSVSAKVIIDAYQRLSSNARTVFTRVFGSSIMPGGYSAEAAAERRVVNTWLRDQGFEAFDAVFEFAEPLSGSDNEATLHPDFDSGDGIHPNDDGYRVVAEAVDISLLSGSPVQW